MNDQMIGNFVLYFSLGLAIVSVIIGLIAVVKVTVNNIKAAKEFNQLCNESLYHDDPYKDGYSEAVEVNENGKPITGCGSLYKDQVRELNNRIDTATTYRYDWNKKEWYRTPFKVGQTVWYIADSGDRICTFTIDRVEVFIHSYSGLKTYVYFDKDGYQKLDKDLFSDFGQAELALDDQQRGAK